MAHLSTCSPVLRNEAGVCGCHDCETYFNDINTTRPIIEITREHYDRVSAHVKSKTNDLCQNNHNKLIECKYAYSTFDDIKVITVYYRFDNCPLKHMFHVGIDDNIPFGAHVRGQCRIKLNLSYKKLKTDS